MFIEERLNMVKRSVLANLIYRFNVISIKIQETDFVDINKFQSSYGEAKTQIANTILKKKKKED